MSTRRDFLKASAVAAAFTPYVWSSAYAKTQDKNSRMQLGMVGCGGKGRDDSNLASAHGDFVAVCDCDRKRAEGYAANPALNDNGRRTIDIHEDYRELIARDDVDAVICATPDHWHVPVFAAALRAGKHVYGEKPMTLTVDEVKVLRKVVADSDATFQVGNQQRSCQWFREAVAIAQSGILGGPITATCYIGRGRKGGPFQEATPPEGFNWDLWLGQAPYVPYIPQRTHGSFRWWLDYSGGTLTDWGAHHIDIAQWGIGALGEQPISIEGEGLFDDRPNCYNTAQTFNCTLTFANGNKIIVTDGSDEQGKNATNGILFEGTKERIFVNRGKMTGNLVNILSKQPERWAQIREAAGALYDGPYGLPDYDIEDYNSFGKVDKTDAWTRVKQSHMANLFRSIEAGAQPISDVVSVGNATISCHLCNIAMRVGRKLTWDPKTETVVGDAEAGAMLKREAREGYGVEA